MPGEPLDTAGVCQGDAILEINDESTKGLTDEQIAEKFADAGESFSMIVAQVPNPEDVVSLVKTRTFHLKKDADLNYGFKIATTDGISRVAAALPRSPAASLGAMLRIGDRIVSINNASMLDAAHETVMKALEV